MNALSCGRGDEAIFSSFFNGSIPLLFIGESGTGKTYSARMIHKKFSGSTDHFFPLNCAGISESLAESTLFGCIEGAFTGAQNGTVFLDEVAELSLSTQAKLLQVLSERIYSKVGSSIIMKTNARVMFATNADLKECVKNGTFRQDLYYRISMMPIYIKPLCDRRAEIPFFVMNFLKSSGRGIKRDAMDFLVFQKWEGNLRQLFACLGVACSFCATNCLNLGNVIQAYEIVAER